MDHLKLLSDNFKELGSAYMAFVDLAKQYMSQGDSDAFKDYVDSSSPQEDPVSIAEEESTSLFQDDPMYSQEMDGTWGGYDYNSQGVVELPYFKEEDLTDAMLEILAGGAEMGIPQDLLLDWSPRGKTDTLLPIINGSFTEI